MIFIIAIILTWLCHLNSYFLTVDYTSYPITYFVLYMGHISTIVVVTLYSATTMLM